MGAVAGAQTGEITGSVWLDQNGDGLQDLGEPLVDGVTVNLLDGVGGLLQSQVTGGGLPYLFANLTPGDYIIEVVPPPGEIFTAQNSGPDDTIDSDVDPSNGRSGLVTLTAGSSIDLDAGLVGRGEIVGSIWLDQNGDGLQSPGEPFLDGITVNLYDDGALFLQSAVTAGGGFYVFSNLLPDGYVVEVVPPIGEIFTIQDSGTDDTIDSDVDPGNGRTGVIALDAGTTEDVDAGFMGRGEIVGSVWLDQNGDGLQSPGEPFLDGITVNLYDDGALFLQSAVTAGGGFYVFSNLLPDGYVVEVVPPIGEIFTIQDSGADDTIDSDVDPSNGRTGVIALDAGTTNDFDAGLLGRGGVFGFVWLDLNGDGIQDPGESGIDKVEVRLLDSVGSLLDTAITAAGGLYEFPNLLPGSFIIEVVPPAFRVFTFQDVGADDTIDSDVDPATGRTAVFPVSAGTGPIFDAGMADATWSHITDLRAVRDRGQIVVEWETRAEAGTVGFLLHREDPASGELVPVLSEPMQSFLGAPQGGTYRVADPSVPLSGLKRYWLEELTADGRTTLHGPFEVEVGAEQAERPLRTEIERRPAEGREAYREARARKPAAPKARRFGRGAERARVAVRSRGLVFVEASAIATALDLPHFAVRGLLRAGQFSLTHAGRDVPWLPARDGLYFFAPGLDSIFTDEDVYWLRKGRGVRMTSIDGRPQPGQAAATGFLAEVHHEENLQAVTVLPLDSESDYWFWALLRPGHPRVSRHSFSLDVPELDTTSLDEASITVHLQGMVHAPVPHVASVSLNGVPLGEARFDDLERHSFRVAFDPLLLESGENALTVEAIAAVAGARTGFAVDGFDLVYPRTYRATGPSLELLGDPTGVTVSGLDEREVLVLDITDPLSPQQVSGVRVRRDGSTYAASFATPSADRRYWVSSPAGAKAPHTVTSVTFRDLLSPTNRADHLVIAPDQLAAAALDLVELRESQGLESMFVSLEEIVDELQHGIFSPHAIREFLRIAFTSWQRPPRYVVLVGSGTFDYENNLGEGDNLLPPYMVTTPTGLHPSDQWLADVVGEDGVPELAIGRIPVLSDDELRAYIDKLIAYEGAGSWTQRIAFLADDPDSGGDFSGDSDTLAALLRPTESPIPLYLADSTVPQLRQSLFETLEAGVGQLNYFGHAGTTVLAAEGLLTTDDVDALAASGRPTLVTAFTCTVNYFAVPGVESLGEALIRAEARGAVAVWAPSWLSGNGFARALGEVFFAERAAGPGRLGDHVVTAIEELAARGLPRRASDGFVLLGDPATTTP